MMSLRTVTLERRAIDETGGPVIRPARDRYLFCSRSPPCFMPP
jgi:hypothetical protein